MRTRSLSRQAIAIVFVTQMLSSLLLGFVVLVYERNTRFHAFDVQIQGRSDSILGAIQDAEDPSDNVSVDPAEVRVPNDEVYAVYSNEGKLLAASSGASDKLIVRRNNGYSEVSLRGLTYRIYQREGLRVIDRAETGGVGLKRPVTIVYAAQDGHIRQEIFRAVRFYLLAVVVAGAITAGVVSFLLRQAMRPIAELADVASNLSPRTLKFECPPSIRKVKELRPLVAALTGMLASLRHAFVKEQRFFGDAAHELKTAIAVVRSSVQLLMLKDRKPLEYRVGLERVLEDNARVEKLAAQMLKLAAAEDRSREPAVMLDFSLAVCEVCLRFESLASLRNIAIETQVAPGIRVRLTYEDVQTLVSNLLFNAIQHSSSQSIVHVSATEVGSEVQLQIRDTGEGIGEEALPHIFERFYREDASRSRETGGTGLGLSICKAIVDAAEGTIQIQSARGISTTVLVHLNKKLRELR